LALSGEAGQAAAELRMKQLLADASALRLEAAGPVAR
ncbi:MAG: hypothetical protein QOJ12_2015, partial [Thermoleophilales bacterium]|nr:hypothetical protein [Thermoleophilales bacterium]